MASTTHLVQLLSDVLPKGVLNVVNGDGASVGEALTTHPDVGKVSFTGSTCVGKHIQKMATESCKLVGLELGGKGPKNSYERCRSRPCSIWYNLWRLI
ncbi:aldehyde dehydrogenase family protein [Colwellia maritima]|uniref:aldehyde dehydrogenase family protein n=1 Tax=Colwellia maritima TaxID=2912588 RepID=UPI003B849490